VDTLADTQIRRFSGQKNRTTGEKSVSGANPRRIEADARRDARLTAAGCAKERERERGGGAKKYDHNFDPFVLRTLQTVRRRVEIERRFFVDSAQGTAHNDVVGIRAQGCQPINGELIMSLLRGIPGPAVPSIIELAAVDGSCGRERTVIVYGISIFRTLNVSCGGKSRPLYTFSRLPCACQLRLLLITFMRFPSPVHRYHRSN